MTRTRITLRSLNEADCATFVATLGWVFERSPWVSERAWTARPFADIAALHAAMVAQVEAASIDDRHALLCAHPDLGARTGLTDASLGEQRGAGLDHLTSADHDRLQRLTSDYHARFGFPFVLAVKGRSAAEIMRLLERRLDDHRLALAAETAGSGVAPSASDSPRADDERQWALGQVYRIAEWRLQEVVA